MEYKIKSCAECEKKCENCNYRKTYFSTHDDESKISIVQPNDKAYISGNKMTNFLLVVLILMLLGGAFFYYQNEYSGRYIKFGNTKVRIKEDSYADNLIDCGYLSLDDVQDIVDSVLGQ